MAKLGTIETQCDSVKEFMKTVVHLAIACSAVMVCCSGETSEVPKTGDKPAVASCVQRETRSAAPRAEELKLHTVELLSYATVRITCANIDGKEYAGTGFFYELPCVTNPAKPMLMLVSNRHLAQGTTNTTFVMSIRGQDFLPSSCLHTLSINNLEFPWINHPDPNVDLSVLLLDGAVRDMQNEGKTPFYFAFNSSHIPDMKFIRQTDEVIMIGYPDELWDPLTRQPIFRKGSLATNPNKGFCGRRVFLVDLTVHWGASGSPVLLFSEDVFGKRGGEESSGNATTGRLKLLGLNCATVPVKVNSKAVMVPVDAGDEVCTPSECGPLCLNGQYVLATKVTVPDNSGIIVHSSCIKEMEEVVTSVLLSHARERENDAPMLVR